MVGSGASYVGLEVHGGYGGWRGEGTGWLWAW